MSANARWSVFRDRVARNRFALPLLIAVTVASGAAVGQPQDEEAGPEDEITLEEGIEALVEELDLNEARMTESIVTGLCKKTVIAKWSTYGKRTKEGNARLWLVGGSRSRERGQSAEITVTFINPKCGDEGATALP